MSAAPAPLHLLAEDAEDLQVISAALQDAVTTVGEIVYQPAERQVTITLNRFCWECGGDDPVRIRAGLQVGGVLGLKSRDVPLEATAAAVSILALTYEPCADEGDPGGALMFHLAGGGDIRAEVECIDAVLTDISDRWAASSAPRHEV